MYAQKCESTISIIPSMFVFIIVYNDMFILYDFVIDILQQVNVLLLIISALSQDLRCRGHLPNAKILNKVKNTQDLLVTRQYNKAEHNKE